MLYNYFVLDTWIGLNDQNTEDDFHWVADNEELGSWNDWIPGKPNDSNGNADCIALIHNPAYPDSTWDDKFCTYTYQVLCEQAP